ncbi:hypothetical protein D0441_26720 [Priestia megaterium]|nr:hypothetical protein D0441_26720 [Priestia megaterium]
MRFLYIFLPLKPWIISVISRMYKKLHNKETLPSWKSLYAKGFLFPCVPERDLMLTTFVYHIHHKKRKSSCAYSGAFSKVMLGEMMIFIILGSLLVL